MRVFVRVLVALVVLGLVFVAVDRVAAYVAEDRAEAALSSQFAGRPNVEIHGFPFLTQWGAGTYRETTVASKQVSVAGAHIDDVVLTLDDVHTKPWAHTPGDVVHAKAGTVRLSGTMPFSRLPLPNGVTAKRYGTSDDKVRLSGTATVFGQSVKYRAVGAVSLEQGRIKVSPRSVHVLGDAPSSALTSFARNHLTVSMRPPGLPAGLSVTAVKVTDKGIRVTASGKDVKLPHA